VVLDQAHLRQRFFAVVLWMKPGIDHHPAAGDFEEIGIGTDLDATSETGEGKIRHGPVAAPWGCGLLLATDFPVPAGGFGGLELQHAKALGHVKLREPGGRPRTEFTRHSVRTIDPAEVHTPLRAGLR